MSHDASRRISCKFKNNTSPVDCSVDDFCLTEKDDDTVLRLDKPVDGQVVVACVNEHLLESDYSNNKSNLNSFPLCLSCSSKSVELYVEENENKNIDNFDPEIGFLASALANLAPSFISTPVSSHECCCRSQFLSELTSSSFVRILPYATENSRYLITLQIGGININALVDTGATHSYLDFSYYKPLLQRSVTISNINAKVQLPNQSVLELGKMAIAPVNLLHKTFTCKF